MFGVMEGGHVVSILRNAIVVSMTPFFARRFAGPTYKSQDSPAHSISLQRLCVAQSLSKSWYSNVPEEISKGTSIYLCCSDDLALPLVQGH